MSLVAAALYILTLSGVFEPEASACKIANL